MERPTHLKSERDAIDSENCAALAIAAQLHREANPEPENWLGVAPGVAKIAAAQGIEFTYGPGETPSNRYLDLLIEQLKEIGVSIKFGAGGKTSFVGSVEKMGPSLLDSCKRVKAHLIRRYCETVASAWTYSETPLLPEWDAPIEWTTLESGGRCAGEDLPPNFTAWRYLYGERRNEWHSASGWTWIEGAYDEPQFRRIYKPYRKQLDDRERQRIAIRDAQNKRRATSNG